MGPDCVAGGRDGCRDGLLGIVVYGGPIYGWALLERFVPFLNLLTFNVTVVVGPSCSSILAPNPGRSLAANTRPRRRSLRPLLQRRRISE